MVSSVTAPSLSASRVVIGGITMRFLISTLPIRAGVRRMDMVDHSRGGLRLLGYWGAARKLRYDEFSLWGRERAASTAITNGERGQNMPLTSTARARNFGHQNIQHTVRYANCRPTA